MKQLIKCIFSFHNWEFMWKIPEKKSQGYSDYCGLVRDSFEICQECGKIRWGLKYPPNEVERQLRDMKKIEAMFQ